MELTTEKIQEINEKNRLNEIEIFKKMSKIIHNPEVKNDKHFNSKYSLKNLSLEELCEIQTIFWIHGQKLGLSNEELTNLGYPKKIT